MNANSNINTDLIRDSTEDDQSTLEEVTSARDTEEHQQSENETDLGNSDSEYVLSDTDLANDLEPEEERSNLELSTETGRDPEETYIPKELKKGIFKFLITLRDWTYIKQTTDWTKSLSRTCEGFFFNTSLGYDHVFSKTKQSSQCKETCGIRQVH